MLRGCQCPVSLNKSTTVVCSLYLGAQSWEFSMKGGARVVC